MSAMNSPGERLRRANQLWHAHLARFGVRFDLVQFLKDPELEKQVVNGAIASGDAELVKLAQDWLRDTGQATPAYASMPGRASPAAPGAATTPEPAPKPGRYLRGVR